MRSNIDDSKLSNITKLKISNVSKLDSAGVEALLKLFTKIIEIDISECSNISLDEQRLFVNRLTTIPQDELEGLREELKELRAELNNNKSEAAKMEAKSVVNSKSTKVGNSSLQTEQVQKLGFFAENKVPNCKNFVNTMDTNNELELFQLRL